MPAFPNRQPPADFDQLVATPGNQWLLDHPNHQGRPPDHWNKTGVKQQLRANFRKLCGYSLMHEMRGTVDHYISWDADPSRAYDWSNYRYCTGAVNSSKQNADDTVFDPFEIEFDWFEIHLPSMIMRVSANAPPYLVPKLEYSLRRLPISDTDEVIDYRAEYYEAYKRLDIRMPWLRTKVPVLAASVAAWELANPGMALP